MIARGQRPDRQHRVGRGPRRQLRRGRLLRVQGGRHRLLEGARPRGRAPRHHRELRLPRARPTRRCSPSVMAGEQGAEGPGRHAAHHPARPPRHARRRRAGASPTSLSDGGRLRHRPGAERLRRPHDARLRPNGKPRSGRLPDRGAVRPSSSTIPWSRRRSRMASASAKSRRLRASLRAAMAASISASLRPARLRPRRARPRGSAAGSSARSPSAAPTRAELGAQAAAARAVAGVERAVQLAHAVEDEAERLGGVQVVVHRGAEAARGTASRTRGQRAVERDGGRRRPPAARRRAPASRRAASSARAASSSRAGREVERAAVVRAEDEEAQRLAADARSRRLGDRCRTLPSDFDIFSAPNVTMPLCTQ